MTTDLLERPVDTTTASFILTSDQQAALEKLIIFMTDPVETVFVLQGFSGCGKSTLIRTFLDRLTAIQKTARLINTSLKEYTPVLTATTNKAAENLAQIAGYDVRTIHSVLGLRVQTDYRTNTSKLIPKPQDPIEFVALFIDEASYIDKELLGYVFSRTKNSKVIFIGDPAQLTPVKATSTPVFDAGFSGAALTQVVRQAEGNPIVDLSTKFRHTVNTGEFFGFTPDGHHVQRLTRAEFNAAIEAEFTREGWSYSDSKILAYTNKCAIGFNEFVRSKVKGDPHFQEGDYAVCNTYLQVGKQSVKTDQLVLITAISEDHERHGVMGNMITMDHVINAFHPKSLAAKNEAIKVARKRGDFGAVTDMEAHWVDLRGAYASTINKAQGSTFGSVFVDLDDVARCTSGDQIARMLYVGVSRARNHVYLCGDLA